jgi:hypothetical protein
LPENHGTDLNRQCFEWFQHLLIRNFFIATLNLTKHHHQNITFGLLVATGSRTSSIEEHGIEERGIEERGIEERGFEERGIEGH